MADQAAPTTATQAPAIELAGITKRFPGVIANDDVTLAVERGSLHAIVGENGAGKSTLMKILYGILKPDAGTITVDGKQVAFRSAKDAIEAGIGMVHQHFQLMDNFTVLENIVLGAEPRTRGVVIDFDRARQRIEDEQVRSKAYAAFCSLPDQRLYAISVARQDELPARGVDPGKCKHSAQAGQHIEAPMSKSLQ